MVLIIGGAYQGKLAYAKEKYPEYVWIDGAECQMEEIWSCRGIYHFHKYIERFLRRETTEKTEPEEDLLVMAGQLAAKNPDLVIVTDEIGYGIVPADPFERMYREITGRVCTKLAAGAEEVYRVICGVGMRIK